MTETVSKRVESNRRNAQKSTGPRTQVGKEKVRLNAIKHGLTASIPLLPGEDAEAFKARGQSWRDELQPRSELAEYLLERAVVASWQLDRCDRAQGAKLTELVRFGLFDLEEGETEEVEDLARQLFFDPRGPIALYPHFRGFRYKPRVSGGDELNDPIQPARIVNRLASLDAGCRWLLERWSDLRRLLEDDLKWQAPDRLRAIRLLGRQPMDALADDRVLMIYLACDAMEPTAPTSLDDLLTETTDDELKLFKERVKGRGGDRKKPASPEAAKAALLSLIEQAVAPLADKMAAHRAHQEFLKSMQADFFAYDDSPEGELMRRYRLARGREFNRLITLYFKVQREAIAGDGWPDAARLDRDGDAPTAAGSSIAAESVLAAEPESPAGVAPTDPGPCGPVACAEPASAPPTAAEAPPGNETKPNPPEHPRPEAAGPTLAEYVMAAIARIEPSRPLPSAFLEDLNGRDRPPTS